MTSNVIGEKILRTVRADRLLSILLP